MSLPEPPAFADQLSIDTPELVELHLPLAGLGSRFVAVLLDHLIQGALFLVLILAFVAISMSVSFEPTRLSRRASFWLIALLILAAFLILWGYFVLVEAYNRGQTPGKRLMKLRVLKDSGRQITLFEAMVRNLLRYVDQLPTMYLAGVVTMLLTRRSQRLGDLAAGTLVVHERTEDPSLLYAEAYSAATPPALPIPLPADAVARLSPEDLVLIEAFFARALDLPLAARAGIAARLAAQLYSKMELSPPSIPPERLLESIALALRRSPRRP